MFGFGEINFVISVLDWVKNNLVTFLIAGVAGISLWWKMLIQQQADNIVNSRDGSGVPQHGITLAALTRKALTMPAQLLRDAAVLGAYHVKWVSAAPLVVATHPNTASIVLSDKFKCKRDAYNCEPKGVLALRDEAHMKAHQLLVKVFNNPDLVNNLLAHLQARLSSETFPEMDQAVKDKENLDLVPVFEELWVDTVALWVLGIPTPAEVANTGADKVLEQTKRRERIVEARRCLSNLTFVLPTGYAWYFDLLREHVPFSEFVPFLPGSKEFIIRKNAKAKARVIVEAEFKSMFEEFKQGNIRGGVAGAIIKETMDALEEGVELDQVGWQGIFDLLDGVQASAQSPLYSIVPHLLLLLAHSPANQKLIVSELSKVNLKTALTTSHLTSFKHLNACVLEALRTLPPQAVSYNRSSNENAYKLPGGGGQWSLPKGCHIAVDLLSTMRNENSFGQDRNAFVPSRFASFEYVPTDEISKADNVKTLKAALEDTPAPIQAAFMPFGNGHFGCPAQRLALSVTKVAVAEVVRRFELTPVKGREGIDASGVVGTMEEFSYQQSGVLKHVDGAPVSLKRRK